MNEIEVLWLNIFNSRMEMGIEPFFRDKLWMGINSIFSHWIVNGNYMIHFFVMDLCLEDSEFQYPTLKKSVFWSLENMSKSFDKRHPS